MMRARKRPPKSLRAFASTFPWGHALYVYGSYGIEYARADSDVDIAVLLPHAEGKAIGPLAMSPCRFAREDLLHREVDLINLQIAPPLLQTEATWKGICLFAASKNDAVDFEIRALRRLHLLEVERAEIVTDELRTGRIVRP